MSEPIGISITIGGELPAPLIERLLNAAEDQIEDISEGPTSMKDLRAANGKTLRWQGLANYGDVSNLMTFCEKHKLSFIYHCEGKYEYCAEISFWVPGMKHRLSVQSDQSGNWLADTNKIRPLAELLLGLAKDGYKILPAFLTRPGLEDLVENGLKYPSRLIPSIEELIRRLLPEKPTIPPFTIKEGV
jgi:hypothetical protein